MKRSIFLIVASGFAWIASCSDGNVVEEHHRAVMEGYEKLPAANSLKEHFAAWSFITHFNIPTRGKADDEKKWNTISYVNGRYELNFVQQIQLDASRKRIGKPLDAGRLLIKEIKEVHGEPYTPGTRYGGLQIWVEGKELQKLVDSGWDFAAIGITLKKEPVKNIDRLRLYHNRIHPLQVQEQELR